MLTSLSLPPLSGMKKLIITLVVLTIFLGALKAQPSGDLFFSFDQPMGNVAVTHHQVYPIQVFFSVHPESKPKGPKIYEIKHGIATPFPDSSFQEKFISPLGVYLDHQNRLWVLDHGKYAFKTPKLFAFDANTGELLLEFFFTKEIVKKYVMLDDLSVTPDGKYVFISAPGLFKKRSSIIVFNVEERKARRILTDHPSVMTQKITPAVDDKKMQFVLGLYKVRPGVDGIEVNPDGTYLYYAAMSHQKIFRIPVDILTDFNKAESIIEARIEELWDRPLCDGIRIDDDEMVYITDFENHQVLCFDENGNEKVVFKNEKVRWADGLSLGADGYLYITDSALQHVIMKSEKKFKEHAPFGLWRVKL